MDKESVIVTAGL